MIMPANGLGGQIRQLNTCKELDVGQCKVAQLPSYKRDHTRRRHSVAKRLISYGGRVYHVEVTLYALGKTMVWHFTLTPEACDPFISVRKSASICNVPLMHDRLDLGMAWQCGPC